MKSPVHGFVFVFFFCFLFFVFTIFTIHQWQVLSAFLSLTKLQCLCIPLDSFFFFNFFLWEWVGERMGNWNCHSCSRWFPETRILAVEVN